MKGLLLWFTMFPPVVCAQPGWVEMQFSFVLEKDGAEVLHEQLRTGGDYYFEVEGRPARLFTYADKRFTVVAFNPRTSDMMNHVDTLWLRITHREAGVMEIAFPPRAGREVPHSYLIDHMVVPFAPGRVSVTDLEHELHVIGTMEGLGQWWNGGPVHELYATCGSDTVREVATHLNGRMDLRIRCSPAAAAQGNPMAEVQFISDGPFRPDLRMRVRGPASGGGWDLGTLVFKPTRLHFQDHHKLAEDNAAVRDTVFGWDRLGNVVHLSNAHPTSQDSLRFRFWWIASGEEVCITHETISSLEGEVLLVFHVRRLRDKVLWTHGYRERELEVVVPPQPPRTYGLGVDYEENDGGVLPRFDALIGRSLEVR
ncbi:MAG: hypothetical protein KDB84_09940 [Flavobacteriales bacterium]|nr:hypothetical protein [Flavobacteriales bacterium]